ncbi:hypothetical protein K439DRAFT_1645571 [Ramaria rubella]|nr:hypothetical protein K439DRAFT_1645571 [Ramaria rubella]
MSIYSTNFFLVGLTLAAAVIFATWRFMRFPVEQRPCAVIEKSQERALGKFAYPDFKAWIEFDVHTTKPIAYRPFRRGPNYSVTMGIRSMPWDSWIELDNTGEKAIRTLPGAEKAALEVCTELVSYLAKRYPHIFKVTRVHDRGGLGGGDSIVGKEGGRVKTVEILPTGDKWDLDVDDPMTIAGLLAEDLAIMVEGGDGQYYLRAGAICVPGFWRLEDKIGLPLKDIHLKGGVYQYKEKLQLSLDRFFRKLPVDRPVLRNNIDDNLAWANIHHGNEDDFDQSTHMPLYFRSERQSLRRMPKTGCICFTIRTYFHRVTEIVAEPGVPGRLAAAIRSWPEPIAQAKGKALFADAMLPWLDNLHQKQIDAGVANTEENPDSYPY